MVFVVREIALPACFVNPTIPEKAGKFALHFTPPTIFVNMSPLVPTATQASYGCPFTPGSQGITGTGIGLTIEGRYGLD